MSVEADFHAVRARDFPFRLIQAYGTTATWTWAMADIDRFMAYSVVTTDSNAAVSVLSTTIRSATDGRLTVALSVRVDAFDQGSGTGFAPLNFFAVRIPPL
jgi:hypothetical protein